MDEQSELIKEVFAHFGTAYFESEVLHRGLCNIYALVTFDEPENVTRPRVEEKLSHAYLLTLGQVIRESRHLFPENIQEQLEFALIKRNFLAHRFWFEKNYLMFDKQGLLQLQHELIEFTEFFANLDKAISAFFHPIHQKFGITDETIQGIYERLLQGEQNEPLMAQRKLKKQEFIIRVWDVEVADGLVTQIFETDDGNLWQLSDVGLGWSKFEKPGQSWKVNQYLQKHLPSNVSPRPVVSEAWNYEFSLAKGATFGVKRGKREKSYTWGIKEPHSDS